MTKEGLDLLYRQLIELDKKYVGNFDNGSISEEEYIKIALKEDMVSNAISIVINEKLSNSSSIGIMTNARAILEAIALLRMISNGEITDKQISNFRYLYFLVEWGNVRQLEKFDPKDKDFYSNEKDYERKFAEVKKNFPNLKDSKFDLLVKNPLFWLADSKGKIPSYTFLVAKNFDQDWKFKYEFLGLLTHAHYLEKYEADIAELKSNIVNEVLDLMCDFMKENGEINENTGMNESSFDEEIQKNNYNLYVLFFTSKAALFQNIRDEVSSYGKNEISPFFCYTLDTLIKLYLDACYNSVFGFAEQAIEKFRSFIETVSMFSEVSVLETKDSCYLRRGYLLSSRMAVADILKSLEKSDVNNDEFDTELKTLYDDYYKEKYSCDFSEFKQVFQRNSMYFLSDETKSYNGVVKRYLDNYGEDEMNRGIMKTLFDISSDFNHASGYLFDSSDSAWKEHGRLAIVKMRNGLAFMIRSITTFFDLQEKSKPYMAKKLDKKTDKICNDILKICKLNMTEDEFILQMEDKH